MLGRPAIAVIIATSCEAKREAAIWRAIDSALTQGDVTVELIVVVNGARFDRSLLDRLRSHPRLAVHYREEGSYPAAVAHGRTLVATEFFAYLDDDDEYLPGALRTRAAPMLEDPAIDFVATTGYLNSGAGDVIAYRPRANLEQEALKELLRANWMQPCGHLFRSSSVTLDYFDAKTKYYEWTLLAFKLAMTRRLRFLDVPTYRKHDSPESLYKSPAVTEGAVAASELMMALDTSHQVRGRLIELRAGALHATSDSYRLSGDYWRAWRFHLRSLRHRAGWKHLAYTRYLLLPGRKA